MKKLKAIVFFALIGITSLSFFVFAPSLAIKWVRYLLIRNRAPIPSVIPVKQWKEFSSKEGKFSIWFPGTPDQTNDIDDVSGVNLSLPVFFVWADNQTEYAVNFCDYPESVMEKLKKFTPKQQFDLSQSGVVKEESGKIVYQKDITIEGYPARDFEFVTGGKANYSGRERLVLVNGRLYQLLVIFLTANPHPADRDIFFNSFRLQK